MAGRIKGREKAFQLLFAIDLGHSKPEELYPSILANEHEETKAFAVELTQGTYENIEKLDRIISNYLRNWTMDRIACTDRNILRLAFYEIIIDCSTPIEVSINEAVRLAKKYGTEKSGAFVNGVLGNLVKNELREEILEEKTGQ